MRTRKNILELIAERIRKLEVRMESFKDIDRETYLLAVGARNELLFLKNLILKTGTERKG